jgi:hypothetical protein
MRGGNRAYFKQGNQGCIVPMQDAREDPHCLGCIRSRRSKRRTGLKSPIGFVHMEKGGTPDYILIPRHA